MLVVVAAARAGAAAETIGIVFATRFVALGTVVLFSGALLDRVNPVVAAATTDLVRVIAFIVLAAFWHGDLDAIVLAVALVLGVCEAVSEPALLVIAPRVLLPAHLGPQAVTPVREARTTAAYGLLEGMRSSAAVVGPTLAAAVVALLRPGLAATAAAMGFAVSAAATRWAGARLITTRVQRREAAVSTGDTPDGPHGPPKESRSGGSLVRSAFGGIRVLWQVRWLRAVQILAVVHVLLAVGPWMVALPVLIIERGQSPSVYALVLGAFSAGTVVGALIGGRIAGPRRGLIALALLGLFGITALAPAVTVSTPLLIMAFVVGGIGQQAFDVVKMAGLRREVLPEMHGRAFSADFFFSFASLPVGQLVGAVLLRSFAPESIMLWAGCLVLVTTALTAFSRPARYFSDAAARRVTPKRPEPAQAAQVPGNSYED